MSTTNGDSAPPDHPQITKKITGSCHCGLIQYTFTTTFPISPQTKNIILSGARCNCTFCQKFRTTNHALEGGAKNFQLLSPGKGREDERIGAYAPKAKTALRYFCKACGAHCWIEGYYEYAGVQVPIFMVNLATVDQPQEGVDLSEVKVQYYDMLHDNFTGGLRDTPWPGGLS